MQNKKPIFIKVELPESSNIKSAFYDAESKTLRVVFTSGRCYDYFDVDAAILTDWTRAESTGKFFNQYIRPQYNYKEIKYENNKSFNK